MNRVKSSAASLVMSVMIFAMVVSGAQAQPPTGRGGGTTSGQSAGSAGVRQGNPYAGTLGEASIEIDPETGALVVTTDDETNARIAELIKNLDKPVPQVLIKVLFLEVTHSDKLNVGADLNYVNAESDVNQDVISTLFGAAARASADGGGALQILDEDLNMTLHALGEVAKLEVLSRPSVMARNNEEATITVGKEVPFVTNSRITGDGQTINTVEYEDIGIILIVTPKISAGGKIIELIVETEISTITGETVKVSETISAPVFSKRAAQTMVVVPDRRTIVIGGLMENQETESVRKVPILGDIPFFGAFFRQKVTEKAKTELLIFLTPYVVASSEEIHDMTIREKGNTQVIPESISKEDMKFFMPELMDEEL